MYGENPAMTLSQGNKTLRTDKAKTEYPPQTKFAGGITPQTKFAGGINIRYPYMVCKNSVCSKIRGLAKHFGLGPAKKSKIFCSKF